MKYTDDHVEELASVMAGYFQGDIVMHDVQDALPEGFDITTAARDFFDVLIPDEGILTVNKGVNEDELLERVRAHAVVLSL